MKYTYEFRWYANDDWKRPHKTQLFDTWEEANFAGSIYSAKVMCMNSCGINADYRVMEVAA